MIKDQWLHNGYTVRGTETADGARLSVDEITLVAPMGGSSDVDVDGDLTFFIDQMQFGPADEGGIQVSMSEVIPMRVELFDPEEGEEFSVGITLSHDGLDMRMSGTTDDVTFDYSADVIAMTLDEVLIDEDALSDEELSVAMSLNALAGQSRLVIGDKIETTDMSNAASLNVALNFEIEDTKDRISLNASVADLSSESSASMDADMPAHSIPEMIAADVDITAALRAGPSNAAITVTNSQGVTTVNSSSQSAMMVFGIDDGALSIAGGRNDVAMDVQLAFFPLPLSFSADTLSSSLTFPLAPSDEGQAFGLGLTLEELSIEETLWNMLDPGQVLPRDPATLMAQISGMVKVFVDINDPEQLAAMESGDLIPGEPESLNLDQLLLSIAGAELRGSGAFTFAETDQTGPGDMPRPAGSLDVEIDGAQALIDNLIKMGLLTEDSALGARMALTMFAVPGNGPDNLTSRLEVTEDGQIKANGMRVR